LFDFSDKLCYNAYEKLFRKGGIPMQRPRGDNQQRILDFIKSEIQTKGYPPSVREIAQAVGLKSTSTVHGHLQRLEKRGLLHRDAMKPRAMEVMGDPNFVRNNSTAVPVIGRVTAGVPILAEENLDEYVAIPEVMLGEGEHFILLVRGDSMIEAGILDGDHIVVKKCAEANNGEIVVAMIDDSATVKRFFKEDGHFRLQPENSTMEPIYADDVTILGKVISLYRLVK
jgi:repressor LexA